MYARARMVMGHRGGCFLCERMFTLLDISSHVRISAESADIAGTVHVAAAYLGARSVAGRNTRALVVALRRVSASARRLPALLLSAPQHQAARNWNGHMSCHHLHCCTLTAISHIGTGRPCCRAAQPSWTPPRAMATMRASWPRRSAELVVGRWC